MRTQVPPQDAQTAEQDGQDWALTLMLGVVALVVALIILTLAKGGEHARSEVEVAEGALYSWFSHEVDAFFVDFAEDGTLEGQPIDQGVRDEADFFMSLGDSILSKEPCTAPETVTVSCHVVSADDLSGPAGITSDADWVFAVTEGEIQGMQFTNEARPNKSDFLDDMIDWVRSDRPEVWAADLAPEGDWEKTSDTAAALLELGPEFISQSDKYSAD